MEMKQKKAKVTSAKIEVPVFKFGFKIVSRLPPKRKYNKKNVANECQWVGGKLINEIKLINTTPGHDKFYIIQIFRFYNKLSPSLGNGREYKLETIYGKNGSFGSKGVPKYYDTSLEAHLAFNRLVKAKLAKEYVDSSIPVYQVATNKKIVKLNKAKKKIKKT